MRGPRPLTSSLNVVLVVYYVSNIGAYYVSNIGAYYVPNTKQFIDKSANQHSGTAPSLVGDGGMLDDSEGELGQNCRRLQKK